LVQQVLAEEGARWKCVIYTLWLTFWAVFWQVLSPDRSGLAAGEGGEAASRGHRLETHMAVFFSAFFSRLIG
jgi:hypothetical protein